MMMKAQFLDHLTIQKLINFLIVINFLEISIIIDN